MQVAIPEAHGRAIKERMAQMKTIQSQFQQTLALLNNEDQRHVGAVLESLGVDAHSFSSYDLKFEKGAYYLSLTPVEDPEQQDNQPKE
jgi:hypothetical protein